MNTLRYIAPSMPQFLYGPASRLDERHWQSGAPLDLDALPAAGVSAVVLCAMPSHYREEGIDVDRIVPGLAILRAPMVDDQDAGIDAYTIQIACAAADRVVGMLGAGKRVLVTCMAGRNRSGLVSALTIMRRRGMSGAEAVEWIQARRDSALTNDSFAEWLRSRR